MTIIRATHDQANPYACISNRLLRDERLSFKARGLLAMLLSYPDNWELNIGHLASQSNREGKSAIKSAIAELISSGYLLQEQRKDARGRFLGWRKMILESNLVSAVAATAETIALQAVSPQADFPPTENPSDGKPVT